VTDYEILLMLDPEAPEERHDEILARTRELVERGEGGTWLGHEPWGRRKLAYEIDKKGEGVYHLVTFRCSAETLDEISRVLKITDGVMRHMPTRRLKNPSRSGPPPRDPEPEAESTAPVESAAAAAEA
jgi:small subunit ribosomal protein S6